MDDCYLSPEGKFWYGLSHFYIAERIVDKVYGINDETVHQCPDLDEEKFKILGNPERFLEEKGWMKYINRCNTGWWIRYDKSPTQAQIDAVFEETGEDVSKMGSHY